MVSTSSKLWISHFIVKKKADLARRDAVRWKVADVRRRQERLLKIFWLDYFWNVFPLSWGVHVGPSLTRESNDAEIISVQTLQMGLEGELGRERKTQLSSCLLLLVFTLSRLFSDWVTRWPNVREEKTKKNSQKGYSSKYGYEDLGYRALRRGWTTSEAHTRLWERRMRRKVDGRGYFNAENGVKFSKIWRIGRDERR